MKPSIQLAGAAFDSLDAMMRSRAEAAVRAAADDHGMMLDYSPESIARLETILAARIPVPDGELEDATQLWGAYFGEVFRQRYSGEWIMAIYPRQPGTDPLTSQGDPAMPALDIRGSHVYPLLKVYRRLTMGPSEDLSGFYARVSGALDAHQSKQS